MAVPPRVLLRSARAHYATVGKALCATVGKALCATVGKALCATVGKTLCATAVALLALTACGGDDPSVTPTTTGAPTVGLGSAPTTVPAPTTGPPPVTPPAFPSGARQYAEAILAAWKNKQLDRLGDLTTAEVQDQIISIPGPPYQSWHYSTCKSAGGVTSCVFFNDPGDKATLNLTNATLGRAHAGTGVAFDPTEYASDPVEYVEAFVTAWQDGNTRRMKQLANQVEIDYFTHYTPPDPSTDACYSGGAAGSQYVRVFNGDGLEYLLRLTTEALGKAHAIAGHNDPSGSNCI
jgi:hypothetical protein